MITLLAALALATPDAFDEEGAAPPEVVVVHPGVGAIPPEVLEAALEAADLSLPERLDAVSKSLLDRPYVADPLGEGSGYDPDPLARYDVFDCLTFVEEVLALGLAGDPAHAAEVRNALRYGDGAVTYANRHHFMELQWIPENIAGGWLRDTTAEYGQTVHLEREWTAENWANWAKRPSFHYTDDELPIGTMRLDVLPVETALAVADRIRPGSILLTVRVDKPWVPLWITHVGFVFHDGERAVVRHATKMGTGRTRDHQLDWYLKHLETYSWKALGVAILEPIEAGPLRR